MTILHIPRRAILTLCLAMAGVVSAQTTTPGPVAPVRVGPMVVAGRRERRVDFVWFSGRGQSASGGASPMTVRVEDNPSREPSVGVVEEFVSGLGDMWRTATWIAAINATQANRQYVNDYEFLIRVGGLVDGPSAGMLMTVAMLAAIRGDPLIPHTTMTGTINPDGTCGPVGGIPNKMKGAIEKGYIRFGYPVGARTSTDLATGERVDLVQLGRTLGMKEVREIIALEDAYHFFTGVRLDAGSLALESEMELDFDLGQQFRSRAKALLAKMQTRVPRLQLKLQRATKELVAMVSPLIAAITKSEQALAQHEANGWFAAAYLEAIKAEVFLRLLEMEVDFIQPILTGDLAAAEAQVASLANIRQSVESFAQEASALSRRRTIGGRLNAIGAMGNYGNALSRLEAGDAVVAEYNAIAQALREGKIRRAERDQALQLMVANLNAALLNYALAEVLVDYSREMLNLAVEEGPVAAAGLEEAAAYGRAFASAAAAALAYFDSIVLKPQSEASQQSLDTIRGIVAQRETNYAFIRFASQASIAVGRLFKNPHEQALYQLGLGTQAYLNAAGLVNKYYSLGATADEQGAVRLGNRRLLTAQLESAKRRALEAAGRCRDQLGFIPSVTRTSYQLGAASREGDDDEKLQALDFYWGSTQSAELALLLGRKE